MPDLTRFISLILQKGKAAYGKNFPDAAFSKAAPFFVFLGKKISNPQ